MNRSAVEECPLCGGRIRLQLVSSVDDDIEYGRCQAYACGECLERFFTPESSDAIHRKAKALGVWSTERSSTVTASRRSLVVLVPVEIPRSLDLEEGPLRRLRRSVRVAREESRSGRLGWSWEVAWAVCGQRAHDADAGLAEGRPR